MKLRLARREDVPAIVRLLADDQLGAQRERLEDPMPDVYWRAFDVIDGDPNNELVVADRAGEVLACLQITYIPYLSRGGSWRGKLRLCVSARRCAAKSLAGLLSSGRWRGRATKAARWRS